MDAATGLVLYENEATANMYPASITKIMTALVVLDHAHDLTERIMFCNEAVFSIPRDSSHISMDVYETLSIKEALYAMMLRSANEVTVALALHIAGSVEDFVDLMNRRAAGLGATDTHFVNPTGLHSRNHVSTAYDMALIMREAIRHPVFREIIATNRFDIPPTERQPEYRHLLNTHQQIRPGPFFDETIVGGKTGWTTPAGNTLVSYAYRDGRSLIVSVLRGEGTGAFTDTSALLAYGFALPMEPVIVFDSATYSVAIPVYQEIDGYPVETDRVTIKAERDLTFELPPDWSHSWIRYELSIPETLTPPVLLGQPIGRVTVYVQNIRVDDIALIARDAVFAYIPAPETTTHEYIATPYPYYPAPEEPQFFTGRLSFLNNEYILTLAIPIALSLVTIVISLIATITRRKRHMRRLIRSRQSRFGRYPHYRYK